MTAKVRVKICGVRSTEVALAAAAAKADLLGFNFAPVSKRRVLPEAAQTAIAACRASDSAPSMVGIFVNQDLEEVAALAGACGLDYLQLSGSEDPRYCHELHARTGLPVIKALRLAHLGEERLAEQFTTAGGVAILLADAAVDGSWGGSGQAWDWAGATELATRHPLLLAGGLTPQNVAGAVGIVKPWGVDVASGVETGGVTDPAKVHDFISQAKGLALLQRTR